MPYYQNESLTNLNLTPAEQTDLFERFAESKGDERAELCEQIIEKYLVFARMFAKRTAHPYLTKDEAISAANIGLLAALERFDPSRGIQFASFSRKFIIGNIRRENAKAAPIASGVYSEDDSETISGEEACVNSGPDEMAAFMDSYEQIKEIVDEVLNEFKPRDQDIFRESLQEGVSFQSVAKKFGVSRQRVGQITIIIRDAVKAAVLSRYGQFDL